MFVGGFALIVPRNAPSDAGTCDRGTPGPGSGARTEKPSTAALSRTYVRRMDRQMLEMYAILRLLTTAPAPTGPRVSRRAHRRAVAERRAEYARVVAAREAVLVATAVEGLRRDDVALAG